MIYLEDKKTVYGKKAPFLLFTIIYMQPGLFTSWAGDTSGFIVNASFQLQSNSTTVSSNFYLSTQNNLAKSVQWEFWLRISFNPSSANYVDAYLIASDSDLSLNSTKGYFVRIGNTDDEISLYRKRLQWCNFKNY